MAIIRYTNGYNGALRYLSGIAILISLIIPLKAFDIITNEAKRASFDTKTTFAAILGWALIAALFYFHFKLVIVRIATLTERLSAYLYANITLGAGVSWGDAEVLCLIFNGPTWYPMTDVKNIRSDLRRKALLDFAYSIK